MIGLDTNVLVRFLVRDDPAQFDKVLELIQREWREGRLILISQLVVLETEWVLRSRYRLGKSALLAAFASLLGAREFEIEDEASLEQALFVWRSSSADFAECQIGARHLGHRCEATV